jgi:hypothetical protein
MAAKPAGALDAKQSTGKTGRLAKRALMPRPKARKRRRPMRGHGSVRGCAACGRTARPEGALAPFLPGIPISGSPNIAGPR